ncbi:MAG: V-type ATP synthase subunit D [Pikeienuella sp.]
MARLQLSKAQLAKETRARAQYKRYLPALDLKRQQLVAERAAAGRRLADLETEIAARIAEVGDEIPMLANTAIELDGLVRIASLEIAERNIVGVRVPTLAELTMETAPYGLLTRPHWVDAAAERLKEVVRREVEARILRVEISALDLAIVKVMQRVNLFEKVLIPQAEANIKRIKIALGDLARAAVVTSKIAKRKRAA